VYALAHKSMRAGYAKQKLALRIQPERPKEFVRVISYSEESLSNQQRRSYRVNTVGAISPFGIERGQVPRMRVCRIPTLG
jgi:hypothetical protein